MKETHIYISNKNSMLYFLCLFHVSQVVICDMSCVVFFFFLKLWLFYKECNKKINTYIASYDNGV